MRLASDLPDDEGTLDARTEHPSESTFGEDTHVGRRVGPYRVERLIARGGMGRVYLASREDDYEQRVALKVVDRGPERLDVLDRFFRERQILARLEHPNIARILDGGTTEAALPYFVMEYVDGEGVDRYCETRGLDLRRRLELFREICRVVHHAHQNLVVHRDLKPGNILVTADGRVKLLDFGIAKILGSDEPDAADTQEGRAPLTPAYASPEQLLGEPVTTASDVYSLGVLLYRLLSSQHPYRLDGGVRDAEEVCTLDPPPPSAVSPAERRHHLAGALDAIVAKAMHKDAGRRYASAAQLAEDVRRYLADLPVEAYRGTWRERALQRARRHKVELAVVLAILLFAAVATVQWRRAVRGEAVAEAARASAETARSRAEDAQLRAQRVSSFLEDLFKSANPDAGGLTVREILDRGRGELTGALEDEPEVRAELLTTLGTVYNNLSFYEEARELKEEALRYRRAADPSDRADLAADLNNLGRVLYDLGDYDGAARRFEEALSMWRRLGDEQGAVTGMRNLAAAWTQSGQLDEALNLHKEIVDLQRRLFGERDIEVGKSLYSLAVLHRTRGEDGAAEPLLRQALDVFRETLGPRHTRVASVLSTLGRVLHAQGKSREARQRFEEALALRLELLGEDHVHVANTRKNLAALLLDEGEAAAAGELLEKALGVLREKKPAGDWTVADAESLRGVYLAALGRYEEAEPLVVNGYQTIRAAKGERDVATVHARQRVLDLYEAWGQDAKAAAFAAEGS